jgi:hypothetical protein
MNKLLLPVGIILISFCCCPSAPLAPYLVTEEPKVEDLEGVYEFSAQRVLAEGIGDTSNSKIKLFHDGTCELTDFPVLQEETMFSYDFKGLFSGECSWTVNSNGSVSRGGELYPVWSICFHAEEFNPAVKCADITNDGEPYNLVFVFGDPDSNEVMRFGKSSPK